MNGSIGIVAKKFSINFGNAKANFCLSLHDNGENSHSFANGKGIYKFKADNKNINFSTQFCLGSISEKFDAVESR